MIQKYFARVMLIGSVALNGVAHAQQPPTPISLTAADVRIPGAADNDTSAIVQSIILTLSRNPSNTSTIWRLGYHYYNGSFRWEDIQYLYIDIIDSKGARVRTLQAQTPSGTCYYGPGTDITATGTLDFDYQGKQLRIAGRGESRTISEYHPRNHKC